MNTGIGYAHNSQAVYEPFMADLSQSHDNGGRFNGEIMARMIQHMLEQNELVVSQNGFVLLPLIDMQCVEPPRSDLAAQETKHEAAIRLLREWMADESGYDEQVWPVVKKALEENRSSYRRRFSE